ncbi:hypothetical protein HY546_02900, partial [archaeon]|nr:hypothetical protein [archaeon]
MMRPLFKCDAKLVRFNKQLAVRIGLNRRGTCSLFGICAGVVWEKRKLKPLPLSAVFSPLKSPDFPEGRVFRLPARGLLLEAKGCGRITSRGVKPIDLWGPYETGPPGGLWKEFAVKEFDRGTLAWRAGILVCNVPLCVLALPFFVNTRKGKKTERRQLAVEGRLVLQRWRIEDLCH